MTEILESMEDIASKLNEEIQKMKKASEDHIVITYKLDKMFTQLFNIEKFRKNITGIILGDFLDCGYPEQFDEFIKAIAEQNNLPAYGGFKITHEHDKITVPYGKTANMANGNLIF